MPEDKNIPPPPAPKVNPNAPDIVIKRAKAAEALLAKEDAEVKAEGGTVIERTPIIIDPVSGRATVVSVVDFGAGAAPHSRLNGLSKEDREDLKGDKAPPHAWAWQAGLLRADSYVRHVPWQFRVAALQQKWPDPSSDPYFKISKDDFDKAILQADPDYKPPSEAAPAA